MFNKILVAVDGSDCSFGAVKTAASLAEKYGSEITLIYVVALPIRNPGYASELGMIPQRVVDDLENEGLEVLKRAEGNFAGTTVNTIVRVGHPAGEILDEINKGYDLIVMGSRGLGEIRGFVMGSVSDRITHHARCTVMIVHLGC